MSGRRRGVSGLLAAALLGVLVGIGGAGAQPAAAVLPAADEPTFDVRARGAAAARPRASAAQRRLERRLGRAAVVSQAPFTGGVRIVARPGGFLTGRSGERPREVALDYVRDHPAVFGLDAGDLAALRPTRGYRSGSGAVHLWWEQTSRGIPAYDQGLRANVSAEGRLINIGGAPRPDLSAPSTEPRVDAEQALRTVARSVSASISPGSASSGSGAERKTVFAGGDRASLVLFTDTRGVRLAWRVLLASSTEGVWEAVVDAETGQLLHRHSRVYHALVFDHYPGAPAGGAQRPQSLGAWLPAGSTTLSNNNALVYADVNSDDVVGGSEHIAPGDHTQVPQASSSPCPPAGCTWNFSVANSWMTNLRQAGTQLFYYVNNFHDHLRNAPGIGFDAASGAFEAGTRIVANVNDGAAVAGGRPDCGHVNNADFAILGGGVPRIQMYLWTGACTPGVHDVNGADDAQIVYHEYTHGLSFILVGDPLDGFQSGAMAEGWSDWYAMDYLAAAGFQPDGPSPGEVRLGNYEGFPELRTQGLDCPVGSGPPACPGAGGAGPGGYTYGDFGRIFCNSVVRCPEYHHDGEIWVETLWDLRNALMFAHGPADGVVRARALITDAMRLSPPAPSFLDMRNAILQADANRGFGDSYVIWTTFAARGMGLNARTFGDNDSAPIEDFTAPPPPPPPPPPPTPDTTAPRISSFSMTNTRFAVGVEFTPRAAQRRRVREGTSFRFRLSERARVVIALEKARPGRLVGRRCRPATRRLRSRRRCTRYVVVGRLTRRNRRAGRNRIAFSGRIGFRALRTGAHRASVSATDAAGNRSGTRRKKFVIVRG